MYKTVLIINNKMYNEFSKKERDISLEVSLNLKKKLNKT